MKKVYIVKNSWLAKIAAFYLKENRMAITIGATIFLHKTTNKKFLENQKWILHELTHVKQFQKFGKFKFIFLYLFETIKKGYYNNKFEIEARENENNNTILKEFEIILKNNNRKTSFLKKMRS